MILYTPIEKALVTAETIRKALDEHNLEHKYSPISSPVIPSLIVATIVPNSNSNYEALIEAADSALYEAKKSGKNRVKYIKI